MWVEQQLVGVRGRGVRKIFAEEWVEKHADREGKTWVTGGGPIAPKGEREAVLTENKNQEMCMRQDLLFK